MKIKQLKGYVLLLVLLTCFKFNIKACSPLAIPTISSWSISGNNLLIQASSNTIYNCQYYLQVELICNSSNFTGNAPFFYTSPTVNKTSTPFAFPQMTINIGALCAGTTYKFRVREGYGAATFSGWTTTYTFTTPGNYVAPSLTAWASPSTICVPQTSQLTASLVAGCGGGPYTYSWSPSTALTCITCSNPIANPTVTTNYTVTAKGGPGACWTASAVVTLVASTIPPSVGTVTAPVSVCYGETATVSVSSFSGSLNWLSSPGPNGPWTVVGPTTASLVTPTLSAQMCYQATVTGCQASLASNTVCINVNPTPTITVNNAHICNGNSATLTAAGAQNYTWSAGVSVVGPGVAIATPPATTSYTVTGNLASCINSAVATVTVSPHPTITALSNSGPVCQGSPLNIGSTANANPGASFSWAGPGGFSANTASSTVANAQAVASGFYTLTVTNDFLAPAYSPTLSCSAIAQMSAAVVPTGTLTVVPFYTICQNTNLNLTANGIGVSPNSYSWASSTTPQFTSTLQNPNILNVSTSHSGDYSVTAYYTSPMTTLVCTQMAVSNVSVVPRSPVVPFSNANVCQYTTGTFSATALNAQGYSWTGPNGFTSNNQINSITNIQPAASGNYTVQALFSIGTVTCTTTNWIPLNVIPVPSIAVVPNITVCERGQTTFNASAPGAISYLWNGPNSFTMNSSGPMFANLTPSMSGAYTVTASFSNGNLTCYNSNVTNLLVKPILPFNLGPDKLLCSNSDLFLNGPVGATSYNWWGSTSYTSNAQGLFVPALNPANSGVYVLEVDLNGCKTYDSVQVKVLTPIIFTLTPSNRTICRGDYVNFVVGAAQGSENYAYTWNPAIYVSGPTGSVQAGYPLGTTVYNISAYDIACPNYIIQTSFTLTVKQPPQPNIIMPANNVCEPLCAIYNSHLMDESTEVMYDFGHGRTFDGDSINICLPAGEHYMHITAKGKNGCKGTYDYTVPITVYPKPGADFSWTPEQPTTANNNVAFNPTTKYGTKFVYDWGFTNSTNVGGIDTSTAKNPQHIYDNNGKFPVMLIVKNEHGCIDTVFHIVVVDEDVAVYIPNTFTPNGDNINDVFNVKGLGLKQEGYMMQIFDRWGTLIYTTRDLNKGWDGTVKGQKAEDGVYIYSVKVIGDSGVGKKEFKGHVTLIK